MLRFTVNHRSKTGARTVNHGGKQAMKRTYLSVTWTPGVDIRDAQTLGRTIEEVYGLLQPYFGRPGQFEPLPNVHVFGAWTIPAMPPEAAYASVHWYIDRNLSADGRHLLASRYLETVLLEPWQGTTPHFDIAVTDLSLFNDLPVEGRPIANAIGFSRPGSISLVSTHPFEMISNPTHRDLALRQTIAHYIGLMFDAPRNNRTGDVEQHGEHLYCTNLCAMRFIKTPSQALDFAREQVDSGALYCESCQRDLAAQVTGYHFGLN
jgi:hypothetical protein